MRDALFGFYDALGRFTQEHGFKYTDASQAATELASMSSSESLVTGMSIANHLIESGGEHVTAFAKTITEPMEPIACWTCVRSMLETCSLAAWLLDPAIDARTRVARIFALRYEGLEQQLKFGNDLVLRYYAATNVATKSKASYGLMMRGLFLVCFVTRPARVVLTR
jgi:hypothetical protein